jgi:hypothetical protein
MDQAIDSDAPGADNVTRFTAAGGPDLSAEGTMKAGAGARGHPNPARTRTLWDACNALTTSIRPSGEQVGCDYRASARLRRTPRFVQDITALVRFKSLQLSRGHDRACHIEFTAHWANNANVADCCPDLFRNGAADGAVHALLAGCEGPRRQWRNEAIMSGLEQVRNRRLRADVVHQSSPGKGDAHVPT